MADTRRQSAQIPAVTAPEKLTFDQRWFYWYGKFAIRNMTNLMIFGLILGGALSLGLLKAELETDAEVLWVEKGTRLSDEKLEFDRMFGGHLRSVRGGSKI
jgi:hypothetical protein